MLFDDHKVDLLRGVSLGEYFQLVDAGQQDSPELAVFGGLEANVASLD
jgi:hypothetical protein